MIVIATLLWNVDIDRFAASFGAIIVIIDVFLNRLYSYRDCSWLHHRLHVAYNVVLQGVAVPEFAINNAAVISWSHPLCVRLVWVQYECTRPELDIMQDSACSDKATPVHVFEYPDAVHHDNCAKTEANQRDCLSMREVWLKKEHREQASAESCLVVSKDELLLASGDHIDHVEHFLDAFVLLSREDTLVKEI